MVTTKETGKRRGTSGAWILAGVALLVGVDLGAHLDGAGTANVANAQVTGGVVNPADQRNQMIKELRKMSERMDKLTSSFDRAFAGGPVDVAVVEFPKNLVVSSE
jgi:hypothetical protein